MHLQEEARPYQTALLKCHSLQQPVMSIDRKTVTHIDYDHIFVISDQAAHEIWMQCVLLSIKG